MTTRATEGGELAPRCTGSKGKGLLRIVWVTATVIACCIAAGSGCSSTAVDADNAPARATGSIGLRLTPGPGVVLNSVSYTITGPNGFLKSGVIDVSMSPVLSAVIGGIPAGTGYAITLAATSTDGQTTCVGSATFDVAANATTTVPITLRCVHQKQNGSVIINGTLNVCPSIDGLAVSPLQAPVGGTIALDAAGSDLDGVPAPLAYSWTATAGSLAGAMSPHATFTCTAAGTPTVTLTISDGDPGPNCPATTSFQVNCTACSGEGTSCDDSNACTESDLCHSGMCTGSNAPAATACNQGGGTVCDGNGHCVQCLTPANCPGSDTECSSRVCTANACGVSNQPTGTPVAAQTSGDCRRNQCNGTGGIASAADDTDLPVDGNACTSDICTAGVPSNPFSPPHTSCGGAKMCDGNGACVDCIAASDCPGADTDCSHRTCAAGTCGTLPSPYGATCTQSGGTICDGTGSCIPFTVRAARVGTGTALSVNATAVFIESRNVADGALVGTPLALPTAISGANQPLTTSGLAITDAQLSRSVDEHYLVIAGYAAAPGSSNPVTNVSVPRVVGRIDTAGNIDTSTILSGSAFISGNIRTGVSLDGSAFWVGGLGAGTDAGVSSGGIWYIQRGTSGGTQLTPVLPRVLGIANGQLYTDGDTSAMLLLASVGSGLPTTPGQVVTGLPGMPGSGMSPWAFAFFDLSPSVPGIDTAYIANDQQVAVGDAGTLVRGIQKWTYNGTVWSLAATLNLPTPVGYRGLAGLVVGSTVTLVASTVDGAMTNRLVVFVDDGVTAPRVLATSTTNTLFRGVALPPR